MADQNGGELTSRMDDIERMQKLLLRAQVLQADMIEQNTQAIARHEQFNAEMEQWKREGEERGRALDQRIDKLVSSIGELIGRIPPQALR